MAQVGAVACTFVRGADVRLMQEQVASWRVNGLDGVGYMRLGGGGGKFVFELVYFAANAAAAHVWHEALRDLISSLVSIVDDWGTTYTYALLTQLGPLVKQARVNTDGLGTCRASTFVAGEFIQ